jgi:hypothetical protein
MNSSISLATTVIAKEGVVFCGLKDGVALLDLEQSLYFSLNSVAASIWSCIQSPTTIGAIVSAVAEEFEVGDTNVSADIITLVDEMVSKDLIRVSA